LQILFFNPQGNFDNADSHLTEHPDFGGQLVYVKEIAMAMVEAGHKVDIVTRRIVDPDWPEFSASIDHYDGYTPNLRIVRIPCGGDGFLAKEQLWEHLPEFIGETVRFYGSDLPDFVTAHYADGGYCAALMQATTSLGFTFTGHSLGAQKLDKLGMNSANADEMEERFLFSRRIDAERLTMERAYKIITSTKQERMEQYAHPLYQGAVEVHDDSKFSVIPPGVNTRVFNIEGGEVDWGIEEKLQAGLKNPNQPHLLISSRIDEKKNIGNAVAAYCGSPELSDRAGLVICLRGIDDPYKEIGSLNSEKQQVLHPILDMITAAGLREQVDFLNILSQAELAATYRYFARRKSAFVLPSVYEPFGLAPIEAAACGLACVATKNGGPSEIFEDGSGVLVDPFDVSDIARGLLEALSRQEDLSERARKRVLSKYTWDKTAAAYLSVINSGVASGPAKSAAVPDLDAGERIKSYLERRDSHTGS
jgi:sucrose-phosphate synthase